MCYQAYVVFILLSFQLVNGAKNLTSFIINGKVAKAGQFPGAVSLRQPDGIHFCGGSIISDEWVLTAAHCAAPDLIVMAGELKLLPLGELKKRHKIVKTIIHLEYTDVSTYNDLALLKVRPIFELSDKLRAYLPIERYVWPGELAQVAGWGLTEQPADEGTYGHNEPLMYFEPTVKLESLFTSLIVAADREENSFICFGDSGSGMLIDGRLAGVVASTFSSTCLAWGIYTSTWAHWEWIEETIYATERKYDKTNKTSYSSRINTHYQIYLVTLLLLLTCPYLYFS